MVSAGLLGDKEKCGMCQNGRCELCDEGIVECCNVESLLVIEEVGEEEIPDVWHLDSYQCTSSPPKFP